MPIQYNFEKNYRISNYVTYVRMQVMYAACRKERGGTSRAGATRGCTETIGSLQESDRAACR